MKEQIEIKKANLIKEMQKLKEQRSKMINIIDQYEVRIIQIEGSLMTLDDLLKDEKEEIENGSEITDKESKLVG